MQAELDARNEHNCSQTLTQRSAYSSVLLIVPFLRVLTNVSQYYRVPTEFQSLKDEIESLKAEKPACCQLFPASRRKPALALPAPGAQAKHAPLSHQFHIPRRFPIQCVWTFWCPSTGPNHLLALPIVLDPLHKCPGY